MCRLKGRVVLLAASLVGLIAPALVAAQDQPQKAHIVVTMSATLRGGATLMSARGGGGLQVGEVATRYLYARADGSLSGQSSGQPPQAGSPGGAAGGVMAVVGSAPQNRPAVKYDYLWQVDVKPVSIGIDIVTFDLDWKRSELKDGAMQVIGGDHRTVTLRQGEKHLLDFIACSPDARYANLFLDVQASPQEDPAVADLTFDYDLWLVYRTPDGAKINRHAAVMGRQGEAVTFTFPAIPLALDTTAAPESDSPYRLQVTGTIAGRMKPDGSLELALQTRRSQRSPTGMAGDGGTKTFVTRPEETTSIDLPVGTGYSAWSAEPGFRLVSPRHGVSVEGDTVRIDFKRFFEGSNTSILVTVHKAR